MSKRLPRVGITHGDINGVGYEVILKTFAVPEMLGICTPIVYGASKALAYHRKALDIQVNVFAVNSVAEAQEGRFNVISVNEDEIPITLGQPSAEAGAVALAALQRGVDDLKAGLIDVLVTAPINKATIQGDEFHFCGHTEYLEEALRPTVVPQTTLPLNVEAGAPMEDDQTSEPEATAKQGTAETANDTAAEDADQVVAPLPDGEALMILMNDVLRVALVTTHLPLRQVPDAITSEVIVRKLRIFDRSLRRDFGITRPRIAVLSLNPHCGDNGLLGSEEQEVIVPALAEAAKAGVHAYGPIAADGFFGSRAWEHYDGVLAMYHDQGLAAFKALAMDNGVNFTAGLTRVRTSPDHGVAYDIAGKGVADETSFRQAIYSAIDIARRRYMYDAGHQNPLHKLYRERKEDERPFGRQPQMRL